MLRTLAWGAILGIAVATPLLAQPHDNLGGEILPAASKVELRAADSDYARAAAQAIGGQAAKVEAYQVSARQVEVRGAAESWPAFRALRFEVPLDGGRLGVLRLRARSQAAAEKIQGELIEAKSAERMITDQRGSEVVFLWGESALKAPDVAARHLASVWGAGKPVQAERGTIAVIPGVAGEQGQIPNFAAFTQSNGSFYQASATMFRLARAKTAEGVSEGGGLSWRFQDELQNEVVVRHSSFYLHGLVSPEATMTFSMCATKSLAEAEWRYLLAILKERKTPPQRSEGMLKILEEARKGR